MKQELYPVFATFDERPEETKLYQTPKFIQGSQNSCGIVNVYL